MADRVEIDLIVEAISKGFDKIEKDLKGVGTSAKESGDKARQGSEGTKAYGQSLANLKTAAMGAAVVIGGVLVAGLVKSVMAASDAEESLSKFNVVFKDLEGGPEGLAVEVDKLAEATGRSKYELIGAVGALGDLFQPLGFSADAAADLSLQMTTLAIDLSSFNNMPMDEALQRLQGTLIGSHENALAFGVVINENTLKAEMMANGTDKLTGAQFEQAKVQARLNLLMAGTTAAQGDAIRTADGFANQLKALQGEMQELAVEIGQQFMPAALAMMDVLRNFVSEVAPSVVGAAKFMATGLRTAADMATGFGDEVAEMAASQLSAAKSTEALSGAFNRFAGNLSGFKQFGAIITNTDDELRDGVAGIGRALAESADSFEEFNAEINKTEYGASILLNAIEATTGVTYDSAEAFYAAARAAKFSAQSDGILTRGLIDQSAALEENTDATTENAEATEQAARANDELADKLAQTAAQENALDPAIRAANLAIRDQADAMAAARAATEEHWKASADAIDPLFEAYEDLEDAQGEWVQVTISSADEIADVNAELAKDLSDDQKKAYQEILNTVDEGSTEWLAAYRALQGDLTDAQRQALIAQRADLEAGGEQVVSAYTGNAQAAEEAQARIEEANAAIAASYRRMAADAILAEQGINESTLGMLVTLGLLTQAEADARWEFTQNADIINNVLVPAYNDGKLTAEELDLAIGYLADGTANNALQAMALAGAHNENLTPAMRDAKTEALLLEEPLSRMSGMTVAPGFVAPDMAGAISQAERLAQLLSDLANQGSAGGYGGYQNPDGGVGGGANGSGGAATSGAGGASSGGGMGGHVAPGAAVGANYVVPPGYNENWYQPVSTGERVVVTPDGSNPGGNTYNLYVTATDGGANVAREFNYLRALAGA